MNFELNEEQLELVEMVREFVEQEITPYVHEMDEQNNMREGLIERANEMGLLNLIVPEEYGGPGLDSISIAAIYEELGKGCAGIATSLAANSLATAPVLIAGTEEQKQMLMQRENSQNALLKQIETEKARLLAKPDAPIFNFTNPSGLVTQALRTMGYDNVYGVCDAPSGFLRQLRDMTGRRDLNCECFGLNHLSWFKSFTSEGKDVTDEILSHPELYKKSEMRLFDKEITSLSDNLLPNEYLYFYHYRDRAVNSVLSSAKTRGETILEINEHMLEEMRKIDIDNDFEKAFACFMTHYAMRENSYFSIESGKEREEKFPTPTVEEYIAQPENGSYAAVALDYIRAVNTGKSVQMVLSVPNDGAMDFLEDTDVCEITCTIDKDGVHTHKIADVPEMQKNLIRAVKHYENLTVEAIMERSREKAIKALTVHPLVCSYPIAEKLVDAYAKEYKKYIGEWES